MENLSVAFVKKRYFT